MLQMAPMAATSLKPGQSSEFEDAGPSTGLQGLISSLTDVDQAFSVELQNFLQQASPELLRRLEQRIAGGMSLPQAAREFLTEGALSKGDAGLIRWLQERMPDFQERLAIAVESARGLDRAGEHRQALVASSLARLAETLYPSPSTPVSGDPTPALASTATGSMSPQLANHLLQMGMPQPLGGRAWAGALGDRVMWMVQGGQQLARLTLNPPNLGPLEVRVAVQQDQTSVTFLSPHAAVREAVEAALPRLRDLFEQQDMQLARADVGDPGSQRDGPDRNGGSVPAEAEEWDSDAMATEKEAATTDLPQRSHLGLVDLFA